VRSPSTSTIASLTALFGFKGDSFLISEELIGQDNEYQNTVPATPYICRARRDGLTLLSCDDTTITISAATAPTTSPTSSAGVVPMGVIGPGFGQQVYAADHEDERPNVDGAPQNDQRNDGCRAA
jgi:hypothetical protein